MSQALRASIAPFLLLITPFAVFVQHQQYGFSHPEVLIFVPALGAVALLLGAGAARSRVFEVIVIAGLLTLFADVQLEEPGEERLLAGFVALSAVLWVLRQHAARIISSMMATVLALSLLPQRSEAGPSDAPAPAARPDLPLVLHVVLDEYIGIEGLPEDLAPESFKRGLESFFVDRGFRLFGRAYSEYSSTLWSLSHLLNLAPGGYVSSLATPSTTARTFRLKRSAYFDRLARQGYAIRVYQSEYLDMCTDAIPASACHTYRPNSLEALDALPVPAAQKLAVIAGAFLARSELHVRAKRGYRAARLRLLQAHIPLPEWDWERFMPAPLGTMPMFDRIAGDLSCAQGGELVFAHLLMPHDPYMYGAGCEPRPPSLWVTRHDATDAFVPGGTTLRQSRAARYRLYFDQVLCAQRKIAQLLDAIPPALRDEAIVVIQGDHGSRISPLEPIIIASARFAASDYADYFSTLFAVRAPDVEAGYDTRVTSITCLLRSLVESDFRAAGDTGGCSTARVVHLLDGKDPRPRPLPEFWRSRPSAGTGMRGRRK